MYLPSYLGRYAEGGFQEGDLLRFVKEEVLPPKDSHAELAGPGNGISFMFGLSFNILWSIVDFLA